MEIAKCAMCGGIAKTTGKSTVAVRCGVCGRQGPRQLGKDFAIESWNIQQELIVKGKMYESLLDQVRKDGVA